MWAEGRVAEGCHEKGGGPSKHTEVGMHGVDVVYMYTYLFLLSLQRMAERGAVEIEQV